MVEFVSYDGRYPNLCRGKLILKIDGKTVPMPKYCMNSGGTTYFDSKGGEHISKGLWSIDVPQQFLKYKDEIEECVNNNVPLGCCGGCI